MYELPHFQRSDDKVAKTNNKVKSPKQMILKRIFNNNLQTCMFQISQKLAKKIPEIRNDVKCHALITSKTKHTYIELHWNWPVTA